MQHTPTPLEKIWSENEGYVDQAEIFTQINATLAAEQEQTAIEQTIARRIVSMMKYVFGACQKAPEKRATAEKAKAALERIVSHEVSEMGDPEFMMEQLALEDVFEEPNVAEALFSMEEALHEAKDKTKPAANKHTMRSLLQRRKELGREAA